MSVRVGVLRVLQDNSPQDARVRQANAGLQAGVEGGAISRARDEAARVPALA
jgi:hypothetical protein